MTQTGSLWDIGGNLGYINDNYADITVYTMLKHLHARVKTRISKETYQSEDNHRSR